MQQVFGHRLGSTRTQQCRNSSSSSSSSSRKQQHVPFTSSISAMQQQQQKQQQRLRVLAAAQQQQQSPSQAVPPPAAAAAGGPSPIMKHLAVAAAAATLAFAPMVAVEPAFAADSVKIGTCLLQKCQLQLARCLGDPKCLQNIVCLNKCNAAEDEAACQIRCGDLYGDKAVDTFNACAVSDKKCVPQRADEGLYPVPSDCALDTSFDLGNFTGRWFITAGYNPLFDIFDCQEHFFAMPEPGRMAAKINWRINKPNGDFIERSVVQTFVQDPNNPAILYNHGNEYLHYQDDWYILAYKPDNYVVVYYRGKNDAWDGYGGATVYTKARQLPQELIPELDAAVAQAGLKWSDFTITDNTCKPHPPPKTLVEELEEGATAIEKTVEQEAVVIEQDLRSFGRGFTVLEQEVEEELTREQRQLRKEIAAELAQAEKVLAKVEKQVAAEEQLLEQELQTEVQGIESAFSKLLSFFKPLAAAK